MNRERRGDAETGGYSQGDNFPASPRLRVSASSHPRVPAIRPPFSLPRYPARYLADGLDRFPTDAIA
jgi:hypothetical protein